MKHLSLLLFCYCCISFSMAQHIEPMLVINTKMHTAKIKRLSTDASGKVILTCSDDKTARLWDAETGALLKTFHVQMDDGHEGQLYACALSPDGHTAALGGWTDFQGNKNYSIYLFDVSHNTLKKCLSNLPDRILDLEFSHNGHHLGAGFAGYTGVFIFQTNDWSMLKRIPYYGGDCNNIAFDKWGHFATVCEDGKIRTYDKNFEPIAEIKATGGEPYSLSFSPEGNLLAVGYSDTAFVQVLNKTNLKQLFKPDIIGIQSYEQLSSVSFSYDGNDLLAGGTYALQDKKGYCQIRVWSQQGQGTNKDVSASMNPMLDMKPMPDNSFIYCTATEFGRINANGIRFYMNSSETNQYSNRSQFKINDNATEIGITPVGGNPLTFSVTGRFIKQEPFIGNGYMDRRDGFKITKWMNATKLAPPSINTETVHLLKHDETNLSVDISSDAKQFIFGTDQTIYCTDVSGVKRWEAPIPGIAWSVIVSDNNRFVVAALDDGTIRWYSLENGSLILSLFLHPDNKRWILWTPDGRFDCSPDADKLIGWQLNQGPYKEALYYPSGEYYKNLYTPELGRLVLTGE